MKSGVPMIAARLVMGDGVELLLGVADAARNDGAAERVRAGFQDVGAGRQMIGERIVHDVARAEAGGEQRARRAAEVIVVALRLEDRTGRHVQALGLAGRR